MNGTEICPDALWQCGLPELKALADRVHPDMIVCMVPERHLYPGDEYVYGPDYLRWGIDDGDLPDVITLHAVVDMVVARLTLGQKVIVHCSAGLNRSGLVVALALRKWAGMSGVQAIQHVRTCRDDLALCNRTFANYVESWEPV